MFQSIAIANAFATFISASFISILSFSCKHPVQPPITGPGDTSHHTTQPPCSPDSVYFSQQVLPIFVSTCASSHCHDAQSHKDGYILNTYQNIMMSNQVFAFFPDSGKIIHSILNGDPDDRMPPTPCNALDSVQIALIKKWILQGAKNLYCDELCDTSNVTYSGVVKPILKDNCVGCHQMCSDSGNIKLETYSEVYNAVINGSLLGSINHQLGWIPMPDQAPKLSDCKIAQIRIWI